MSALSDSTNTIVDEKDDVEKTSVAETVVESAPVVKNMTSEADSATDTEAKVSDEAEAEKEAVEETNVAEKIEKTEEAVVEDSGPESVETVELSSEEKLRKYEEYIIAGRRFMKTNTFNEATECFNQAATIASEVHGDCTEPTFEANLLYGKALLELWRSGAKSADEVQKEEPAEIKATTIEKETASVTESVEQKGEESAEDPETEDEVDVGEPVRLSWELLETCRCICEKKLKNLDLTSEEIKDWNLKLADVLVSLGDHGIMDVEYEQAQKDLADAIAIQNVHLSATSRILADTTHLLARAFSMDSAFDKAATHFNNSKNILVAKVEELKTALESGEENEKSEIEAEIKELEKLIPELDAFVNDARTSAEQDKIKETAEKELEGVAERIEKLDGEEAKDITDMVRRPSKRPASEEPVEEVKKRKSEEGATAVPEDEKVIETSEESESAATPVSPPRSQSVSPL